MQWAESLSVIADSHAPGADFAALQEHFSDQEISDLSFAIANMNALNRLAVNMRR